MINHFFKKVSLDNTKSSFKKLHFRKTVFKSLLIINIIFTMYCLFKLNSRDFDMGEFGLKLLLFQAVIYHIDLLIQFILKIVKNNISNKILFEDFLNYFTSFLLMIIWIFLLLIFDTNGKYDLFMGPGDSGAFLAFLIASINTYWKLNIIKKY